MQPLLHRMAKRLVRAARMAERAAADMGDDAAMTDSDAESDDDRPLLPRAPPAEKPPPALPAAEKPTKLKIKLKVGGVRASGRIAINLPLSCVYCEEEPAVPNFLVVATAICRLPIACLQAGAVLSPF